MSTFSITTTTQLKLFQECLNRDDVKSFQNREEIIRAFEAGFRSGRVSTVSLDPINVIVYDVVIQLLERFRQTYNLSTINNFDLYWNMLFNDAQPVSYYAACINTLAANIAGVHDADATLKHLKNLTLDNNDLVKARGTTDLVLKCDKVTLNVSERGKSVKTGNNKVANNNMVVRGEDMHFIDKVFDFANDELQRGLIANGSPILFGFCVYHCMMRQSFAAARKITEDNAGANDTYIQLMYDRGLLAAAMRTLMKITAAQNIMVNGVAQNSTYIQKYTYAHYGSVLPEQYKTSVILAVNNTGDNGFSKFLNGILYEAWRSSDIRLVKKYDGMEVVQQPSPNGVGSSDVEVQGDGMMQEFGRIAANVALPMPTRQTATMFLEGFNMFVQNGYNVWVCNQAHNILGTILAHRGDEEFKHVKSQKKAHPEVRYAQHYTPMPECPTVPMFPLLGETDAITYISNTMMFALIFLSFSNKLAAINCFDSITNDEENGDITGANNDAVVIEGSE